MTVGPGKPLQEAAMPPQPGQAGSHASAALRVSPGRTRPSLPPVLQLLGCVRELLSVAPRTLLPTWSRRAVPLCLLA